MIPVCSTPCIKRTCFPVTSNSGRKKISCVEPTFARLLRHVGLQELADHFTLEGSHQIRHEHEPIFKNGNGIDQFSRKSLEICRANSRTRFWICSVVAMISNLVLHVVMNDFRHRLSTSGNRLQLYVKKGVPSICNAMPRILPEGKSRSNRHSESPDQLLVTEDQWPHSTLLGRNPILLKIYLQLFLSLVAQRMVAIAGAPIPDR